MIGSVNAISRSMILLNLNNYFSLPYQEYVTQRHVLTNSH